MSEFYWFWLQCAHHDVCIMMHRPKLYLGEIVCDCVSIHLCDFCALLDLFLNLLFGAR